VVIALAAGTGVSGDGMAHSVGYSDPSAELGEAYGQATARVIPLHRFGTPEEVGHVEAFFASLQAR
jgi:NAD(P)-dependent dehydrogenase (short-subunit alcohol dehydrogenase family)